MTHGVEFRRLKWLLGVADEEGLDGHACLRQINERGPRRLQQGLGRG